mmetsp:Transcript_5500/g.9527  ORF Transcript_5500/g.9527 Transcript_5500/m.9527 type:complete len:114 (+) Transcript_5500:355-696(+)
MQIGPGDSSPKLGPVSQLLQANSWPGSAVNQHSTYHLQHELRIIRSRRCAVWRRRADDITRWMGGAGASGPSNLYISVRVTGRDAKAGSAQVMGGAAPDGSIAVSTVHLDYGK